ncbi:MAG: electron transfer flavoprotein subunit alpha/FixB family protein [Bacteroidetes bacterium]|nr:electron transfer flavoprotein subunit alpha/FixB family protein [Bacteroidota bacterium]
MAVLVYVETSNGAPKKNGLEATSYAAKHAASVGTDCIAVVLGSADDGALAGLGACGASKVLKVEDSRLDNFDAKAYAKVVADVASAIGADTVIFSQTLNGKSVAPRVAVRLNAGIVSGAVALPDTANGFVVKKTSFSSKAFASVKILTDNKVVALVPNSYGVATDGGSASVEATSVSLNDSDFSVTVKEVKKQTGDTLPLPEAELVVSAGRGMKGPENWGIIEDLAGVLGATTACSRPVADVGWRPHHEHVGQTGVAIRPKLYIAIGISGAIQHLAGVNQSKVIVVINKDPEAPFFKAADYGIVGDAFEVVPKLTEALKAFKAG